MGKGELDYERAVNFPCTFYIYAAKVVAAFPPEATPRPLCCVFRAATLVKLETRNRSEPSTFVNARAL